jgi:para-nitrobenzyl esterase
MPQCTVVRIVDVLGLPGGPKMKLIATGSKITALLFLGAIIVPLRSAVAQDDPLVVKVSSGLVRGVPRNWSGAKFLGIPYAQPPVGELRWHEPLPAKPWTGIRDAKSYGAPCAQPDFGWWNHHDALTGQEDCLYLNVVTPQWPPKDPLPVMIWLHGGANAGGTAMSALYTDGTLASHGVVLVSVNYRLGVFGFLAHPELTLESAHHASGNYGLMDQILALKWVIANIAQFGGDPGNITVFGESAGSIDTGILMTSTAKGLFQRAIQESGALFYPPIVPLQTAEDIGKRFAAAMGAPDGAGQIAFLRASPAADLIKKVNARDPHQFNPDVDGWVLTRNPAEVFAAGEESSIPLLIGTTTREEQGGALTPDQLRWMITTKTGEHAPELLKLYGLADGGAGTTDPTYGSAADQWMADSMFRCTTTAEAQFHTTAHHPAFQYEFNRPVPGQPLSIHGSDLTFVLGMYPRDWLPAGKFTETDTKVADIVESYFANFARTGDPNGAGLQQWPQFGATGNYVKFTSEGAVENAKDLRGATCAVYREVLEAPLKQGK